MKRVILAAIIAVFATSGASAATYADGAGQDFTWTNAQDGLGLFGQPFGSPTSNDMFFPFSNFNAYSADGGTTVTADTFDVDLIANEGLLFKSITLITQGDYNITGTAGQNSAEATGVLSATSIVGDPFFGSNSYNFFDDQPTDGNQTWDAETMVAIPWELPTVVTSLHVVADQEVVAISSMGGSADMTAYFEIVGIAVEIIPEPASLSLLALGGLALLRRR